MPMLAVLVCIILFIGVFPGFTYYYGPQTKLREGNVFTPVCPSFCWQGVCGRHPSLGRHPPAETPLGSHPLAGRHPPGRQTLPCQADPPAQTPPFRDGHWSGRYASYWNTFLFQYTLHSHPFRFFGLAFAEDDNGAFLSFEFVFFFSHWRHCC